MPVAVIGHESLMVGSPTNYVPLVVRSGYKTPTRHMLPRSSSTFSHRPCVIEDYTSRDVNNTRVSAQDVLFPVPSLPGPHRKGAANAANIRRGASGAVRGGEPWVGTRVSVSAFLFLFPPGGGGFLSFSSAPTDKPSTPPLSSLISALRCVLPDLSASWSGRSADARPVEHAHRSRSQIGQASSVRTRP